jgi:hypothetical protein
MPLAPDGEALIRKNLLKIRRGKKAQQYIIGRFTEAQLTVINAQRAQRGWEPLVADILFNGRHVYESRCKRDGYSIDDVVVQIISALSATSIPHLDRASTVLRAPTERDDGHGHKVRDEAVFECTNRHPNAELFSVAPKGDGKEPHKHVTINVTQEVESKK